MSVLITGFKAKNGMINASENLLQSLIDQYPAALTPWQEEVYLKIVGDSTHTIKDELIQLLNDVRPECCVFIGQAPGRNNITLESIATNYRFLGPPEKVGDAPVGDKIETNGPAAYMSTLPNLAVMVDRLKAEGIPAAISNNGGNSLCNQILYHGLHFAAENESIPNCGFLHIPALPEQVINQCPQHPFMPLEMSKQAVAIVVEALMAGY